MNVFQIKSFLLLTLFAFSVACGSDKAGEEDPQCAAGLTYDPIQGECVRLAQGGIDEGPVIDKEDAGNGTDDADIDESDSGTDAASDEDMGLDGPDLGCQTDEDGDGFVSMECGGDDCDDTDPLRRPDSGELCDEVDNNCDGVVNEGLDCSFYAHTFTRLYRLDIFAGTSQDLGEVPGLNDIDTAPDGTLYGIDETYLHRYDAASQTWIQAPQPLSFLEPANGFCIDNDGTAYATTGFTLRVVDLVSGASSSRGTMSPASSSGDCVVNKGNALFMTSNHTTPDSFVKLDGNNGASTQIGQTSFDGIWGLTAAWGRVFGTTDVGNVVEIDVATGQTTLVHNYPNLSFYGAASTPAR